MDKLNKKVIDARGNAVLADLVAIYRLASQEEAAAYDKKRVIRDQILGVVGDADLIIGDTFSSISICNISAREYTVKRKEYKILKINY